MKYWVSTMVGVLVVGGLICGCKKHAPESESSVTSSASALPTPPPAPPEEPPGVKILKLDTFEEAVAFAKPEMTDTRNDLSPGASLFATWATKKMKWSDVAVAKDETRFAMVMKDADEERGKRLCVSGTIIQIEVVKADIGKINDGIMSTARRDLIKFSNVGSSGALVERSRARMCGIVIGKYDYSNSGGGTGHAVQVVGMFDLPENKAD